MYSPDDHRKSARLYNPQLPSLFHGPAEPPPQQDLDPSNLTDQPESFSPIFEEGENNSNTDSTDPTYPANNTNMDFSYPRMQNTPILDDHPGLDFDRDRMAPYEPFAVSPALANDFGALNPINYGNMGQHNTNTNSAGSSGSNSGNLSSSQGLALNHRSSQQKQPQSLNGSMGRTLNAMPSYGSSQYISGNYTGIKKWNDEDSQSSLGNSYQESTATTPSHIANKPQPVRAKSAHNLIEQRYRNKINDRFTALQMSVPTLRVIAKKAHKHRSGSVGSREEDEEDEEDMSSPPFDHDEDLEGLEPARKLNKGTILAKSIEYIKFLERKNERIKMEHRELVERARMMGIQLDESLLDGR
ncbi:hypothetical protein ACI3LY_004082 [Candidozyma auris]|uniref:BHLH domain-containing protein n=2 Tax=Candidozyma auris TaxID=498019 RepID=A0A2H1A354_CANAR|nr:hypothetical_protein [[Candida] auris]KND97201.2 hypothetical protein QG37_06414 [[Candida] auris]PIS55917.1 hypothetical protein CJI97_001155 [[Candida] auris]PIS56903.1 hypothetical protein B9J08_001449 [[Candida] auris]PSK75256.1 hypothetical protein CJJ07_004982 [[Candida] auris]QEO20388.1 hypothetical_protein [[Candida] auris]